LAFRVLVVDASDSARAVVAAAVKSVGASKVHETASGFEALKLLPRHRFDLIIADLDLPDIEGLALVNFVKKSPAYQDTPLLVMGPGTAAEQRERGLALGAAEFLGKPFEGHSIAEMVRRHLPLAR
jgi:two-component system chemotaxis response regulator CheY